MTQALERTRQAAKVRAARPSWDDVKREIGCAVIEHHNGSKSARLEGKDQLLRYADMMSAARQIEADYGTERHAQTPTEDVFRPNGHLERLPAAAAAKAARGRGLHAVPGGRAFFFWASEETLEERVRRLEREAQWDKRREEDRAWEAEYQRGHRR